MSENRKIEVKAENDRWADADKPVKVQLHHNEQQSTSFLLSREEALKLSLDLSNYISSLYRDEEGAVS